MRNKALYVIILVIFNALYCIGSDAAIYRAVIGRIVDGDTIDVRDKTGKIFRIRLAGIDCPEKDQAMGFRAEECTRACLNDPDPANVCCYIEPEHYDRYGRLIATVYLWDGRNLCQHLVRQGWAWAYYRYTTRYKKDEQLAQKQHLGVWSSDPPPMAPWDFRALKHQYDHR